MEVFLPDKNKAPAEATAWTPILGEAGLALIINRID